jgi:hypothetical protein
VPPDRRPAARPPAFISHLSTAPSAGAADPPLPRLGRVPATSKPGNSPPSRPSRTPNWVRPGSKKARHPIGNG